MMFFDNYNGNIKDIINKKNKNGHTIRLQENFSRINDKIVSLLRQHGGKANFYDKDGNKVGNGKGDLNWSSYTRAKRVT